MILFQFSSFQLFWRFSNMVRTRDLVLKLSFPKASCSEKAPWASFPKSVFSKQRISATSTTLLFCIFGPGHIAWVPSSYHHHIIIISSSYHHHIIIISSSYHHLSFPATNHWKPDVKAARQWACMPWIVRRRAPTEAENVKRWKNDQAR